MKKLLGIIIVLLLIIIVIISLAFYSYVKNNSNSNNNNIDNKNLNIVNSIEEPYMLDGPGSEYVPDDIFYKHSIEEWNKLIDEFYGNYYGIYNVKVDCHYNENNDFIAVVSDNNETIAEYTFNQSNGLAVEKTTGVVIDFAESRILSANNSDASISEYVDFTDNECIAIGYVTDLNESEFVKKFFPDGSYDSLENFDYRYESNRIPGYGNKFVIVPINNKVNITVYDCYIGDDGELYTDNTLILNKNEPFILLDDYIEYTPSMCVKFEYNGFEEMFPITFSGEDGTLDLNGYEMEVKDISLY